MLQSDQILDRTNFMEATGEAIDTLPESLRQLVARRRSSDERLVLDVSTPRGLHEIDILARTIKRIVKDSYPHVSDAEIQRVIESRNLRGDQPTIDVVFVINGAKTADVHPLGRHTICDLRNSVQRAVMEVLHGYGLAGVDMNESRQFVKDDGTLWLRWQRATGDA